MFSQCCDSPAISYEKVPDHIAKLPASQVLQFEMQYTWLCSLCKKECLVRIGKVGD